MSRRSFAAGALGAAAAGALGARPLRRPAAARAADPSVETLLDGLSHPWALGPLPGGGGAALLTERRGRMLLWPGAGAKTFRVSGLPEVAARGQGGLLDVQPAPDFERTREVFFAATTRGAGGHGTEVFRAELEGARLVAVESVFAAEPRSSARRHFGCRLRFDRAGRLVFGVGEGGEPERAQDPLDDAGKIHRVARDGSPAPGNPPRPGGRAPTVAARGTRNAQGLAVHPSTGRVWFHEHGPRGGDEVNLLEVGADYGWPRTTHGVGYDGRPVGEGPEAPGVRPPAWVWTPSIAPSGMDFAGAAGGGAGDGGWKGRDEWRGSLFVGALAGMALVRLSLDGERVVSEERLLEGMRERVREVRADPRAGSLLLLTDSFRGASLLRVS